MYDIIMFIQSQYDEGFSADVAFYKFVILEIQDYVVLVPARCPLKAPSCVNGHFV